MLYSSAPRRRERTLAGCELRLELATDLTDLASAFLLLPAALAAPDLRLAYDMGRERTEPALDLRS